MRNQSTRHLYPHMQQDEIDFTTSAFKSLYPKILNALKRGFEYFRAREVPPILSKLLCSVYMTRCESNNSRHKCYYKYMMNWFLNVHNHVDVDNEVDMYKDN